MPKPTCLIVDDEPAIRMTLAMALEGDGWDVRACASAEDGRQVAATEPLDLALVDLRLGTASGLDLLPALLKLQPGLPTVMITAYASVDTAVEAMRRGATDYLPKPFLPAEVRRAAREAVARKPPVTEEWPAPAPEPPQELTSLERLEEAHIRRVLSAAPTLEQAAKILEVDKATLWRKRKKYRL